MASRPTGDLGATIAANIRHARAAQNLTQRELARLVNDVDALAVSRWERGVGRPNDENFVALAEALRRDIAWFYAEHTEAAA